MPGRTNTIADSVPAADAMVCTMLFSWIVEFLKLRRSAIEITAAGIDVATVKPIFSPKKTFAAVKTSVMTMPRTTPRRVSSVRGAAFADESVATRNSPFGRSPKYRRHRPLNASGGAKRVLTYTRAASQNRYSTGK